MLQIGRDDTDDTAITKYTYNRIEIIFYSDKGEKGERLDTHVYIGGIYAITIAGDDIMSFISWLNAGFEKYRI